MNKTLEIGSRIKELRIKYDLTQKAVGDMVNVTDKAVSKWECGQGYPDITILPLLAKSLGVTTSYFFMEEPQQDKKNVGDTALAVDNTIDYARRIEKMRKDKTQMTIFIALSVIFLIGIFSCLIINLATTKSISWSLIPVSAIIFTWLIAAAIIFVQTSKTLICLISFSLFLIPLLFVIERATPIKGWFASLALPIALISIILIWIIYFLFFASNLSKFTIVSIVFLFIPIIDLFVDLLLKRSIIDHFTDPWKIFTLIMSLVIAGVSHIVGNIITK